MSKEDLVAPAYEVEGDNKVEAVAQVLSRKELSDLDFKLRLEKENSELTIQVKNKKNKRFFGRTFTQKEMIEIGFHPKQTLHKIMEVLQSCFNKSNATVVRIGYVKNELDENLREEFENGDKMAIVIDVQVVELKYRLYLSEIIQSEVAILEEMIKDLQCKNTELATQIIAQHEYCANMEKHFNKKIEELEYKFKIRFSSQEMKEGGEIGEEEEDEAFIQSNPNRVEIAHWKSRTRDASTCFRKWNECTLNTTKDLFKLENDNTDIVITKGGIFHIICVVLSCDHVNKCAYLQINRSTVSASYGNTSGSENQSLTLNHMSRLKMHDKINVYCYPNGGYQGTSFCNVLTIQRLGE
ncbi:hypothetical protein RFI_04626 [Reticulomyxa filosa]|uniref:Uncharacterized protein n=1 Tax=Reticulomyxa filosa TaxID=46433 RepID=X6P2P3_RETFI|nr:hypothetical protein RFI_04626 [Reticulomyxa filosa]|eukprot:ETO32491.1 hypothetical protein RFI_04626 [Reticulomyxa filosa]